MIKISIPATTANLGAGFDSIGMAVNIHNHIEVSESDIIDISSKDKIKILTTKDNLIYSTMDRLYDICGKKLTGIKIVQENNIPMTRGLGSSSACIVGGLLAGNYLLGNIFSDDEILNIATKIEGHPDNVAPALMGGLVISAIDNDKVYYTKDYIKSNLQMVAIIPDFKLSTKQAREVLPKNISYNDAIFNISRASLFSSSLVKEKYENIKVAVDDRLHQPYRLGLIKNSNDIFNKCYDFNAHGVYISGAGPTIMAIVDGNDIEFIDKIKDYLAKKLLDGFEVKKLAIDNKGAFINY